MATVPQPPSFSSVPEPVWNVAQLFPSQGDWSEADYLRLTNETNHLVELVDGNLEVLAMPKTSHQLIVQFLFKLLSGFIGRQDSGVVFFAGLRLKIRPRTIREPDVVYISRDNYSLVGEDYVSAANLAMEVVSPDDESHDRDYVKKRRDYAEAGIKEYWIVDPQAERIVVLVLDGDKYRVHGEFAPGELASSVLLAGFEVDVAATLAEGKKFS
jgi:Uma2 family endonuclease